MNIFSPENNKFTPKGKLAARAVRRLLKPGRRMSEQRVARVVSRATGHNFLPTGLNEQFFAGIAIDTLVHKVIPGVRQVFREKAPHITFIVPRNGQQNR